MANLLLIFLIKIYTNQANEKDNLTRLRLDSKPLQNDSDSTRLRLDSKPLQNDSDSTRLEKLLDSPSPEIPIWSQMVEQKRFTILGLYT
jgi:hypothetical protein